ncbi:MAG TPA: BamA/TamA family outer membrane protein [Vicinamibacterales bacterium]
MPKLPYWVPALALTIAVATPTLAQEPSTRAEELHQQRAAKQEHLEPYRQNTLEKAFDFIEDRAIFILNREGLYPKLGSLTTGSGFAYGVGWRNSRLLDHNLTIDSWVAGSIKGYFGLELRAALPELADGRAFAEGYFQRRDYPHEDFFGIGADSLRVNQTDFALRGNTFGGRAGVQPLPQLRLGGGVEFLQPRIGRGTDRIVPSIDELFDDTSAPGLAQQPDFLRSSVFVELDTRVPRYPRGGGYYLVELSRYDDRTLDSYSFRKLDVDLQQFIGFLEGRRVIALRGLLSTSDADAGQRMPFYFLPTLGGHDTLRGFRDYRFRGPHALLLQAEYRWEIWSGVDGALFYDAGKVTDRRGDLDFSDLESDYGIGFRFNTNEGIVLRVDAAFGSRDGRHLFIVFGGRF